MKATPLPKTFSAPAAKARRACGFFPNFSSPEDVALMLRAIHEEGFGEIELSAEDWDRPQVRRWVAAVGLRVVHLENLFPPAVAQGVISETVRLRGEFRRRLEKAMAALAADGVPAFSLDFDLTSLLGDQGRRESLAALLREIGMDLYRHGMHLLLPVRIPAAAGAPLARLPSFLRETMSPRVLLAAEIHPHECVRLEPSPAELLRPGRFQLRLARIEYDAEAGNQLTEKLLAPWLAALAEAGPVTLCFRPRADSLDRAFAELAAIRQLLEKADNG